MDEHDGSLVARRPRRSTAGNRMEAALAEFKAEELGQDVEEDNDFIMEVDEQDAFESDFESTDEEGAQEDVDAAAEKMVREEEKQKKKAARSQLDKITAAAHARNKATFNPEAITAPVAKAASTKINRRVSLGTAVDAETGAVLEGGKRKSSRRHTMMSTSMTAIRAKDELEKKSSIPRKTRVKTQALTQDELISRALDMEEGNIKEHRNYLQMEEEKRKRARVVRATVEGPLIRWVSKAEEVTVLVQPPAPAIPNPPPPAPAPIPVPQYAYQYSQMSSGYQQYNPGSSAPYYSPPPQPSTSQMTFVNYTYPSQTAPTTTTTSVPTPYIPAPLAPPPIEKVETVTKNYVVHETSQKEGASKPLWKDTMTAMFGDHVRWDALKVYSGKGRPLSRPKNTCLITGQPAPYRDPRTGVPFADVQAYRTLTKVIEHEFVWSDRLGCYVAARSNGNKDKSGDKSAAQT